MLVIWLGALLVIAGVLFLANQAIGRGRLSGQGTSLRRRSIRWSRHGRACGSWGLARTGRASCLIVVGGALLLFGGFV